MANIKDVAHEAGVSISTASYALNNLDSKVNKQTKERILKAAEKLGYHPNGSAKNLKRQKTDTVGMFLADMSGPFYGEIISGVQEVLSLSDYDLIICNTHGGRIMTAQKFLREKRVDGAIIFSLDISDDVLLKATSKKIPLVVMDRALKADKVYNVLIDNAKGAYDAVNYLIDLGHKTIFYISGPDASFDNINRFSGYKQALERSGLVFNKKWYFKGDFTEQSGVDVAKKILLSKELPDAIFSANDEMAVGIIQTFNENGVKIPGDVSIIGFDDIKLSSYTNPKLTTISRPKYELGVLAAHTLLKAIQGKSVNSNLSLSCNLIIRDSCRRK